MLSQPIFLPSNLYSNKVWLDATQQAVGTVSSWADQSGNSNNALQATGANQPTCTANLQNGRNGLVFNGTTTYLATNSFTALAQPNVLFVVSQLTSPATTANYAVDGIASGNRNADFLLGDGSVYQMFAGSVLATASASNTSAHIKPLVFNGSSSTYSLDNALLVTGNAGTNTITGLTIGSRWDQQAASFFHGNIYEVIQYNRLLSSAEIIAVNRYLSQKWGITIS